MNQIYNRANIEYCDDSVLSYKCFQTEFIEGQGLEFDENYRYAHLPLVAPNHPRVISAKTDLGYCEGVHELTYSVVIPISFNDLMSSNKFFELYECIKTSKLSRKLSWETYLLRKDKLHATICGSVSTGQAPKLEKNVYDMLTSIGPISINIKGLFSGNRNIGRLYLKVYPEVRGGKNMCHELQNIFHSRLSTLYVVGIFNFIEELDAEEARVLEELLACWWDVEIAQLNVQNLWLLKSRDDLVLDGAVEQVIPLTSGMNRD